MQDARLVQKNPASLLMGKSQRVDKVFMSDAYAPDEVNPHGCWIQQRY